MWPRTEDGRRRACQKENLQLENEQQQKLKKNTAVLDVSKLLKRKSPKETKDGKRRIKAQEHNSNKVVKTSVRTTWIMSEIKKVLQILPGKAPELKTLVQQ